MRLVERKIAAPPVDFLLHHRRLVQRRCDGLGHFDANWERNMTMMVFHQFAVVVIVVDAVVVIAAAVTVVVVFVAPVAAKAVDGW